MQGMTQRNKQAKQQYVTAKHNVTLWMMTQKSKTEGGKEAKTRKQMEDSIQKGQLVTTIKEMLSNI